MDSRTSEYNEAIDRLKILIPKALPYYREKPIKKPTDIYNYDDKEGPAGWEVCNDRSLRIKNSYVSITVYLSSEGRLILVEREADVKYHKNGRNYDIRSIKTTFKGYLDLQHIDNAGIHDHGLIKLIENSINEKIPEAKPKIDTQDNFSSKAVKNELKFEHFFEKILVPVLGEMLISIIKAIDYTFSNFLFIFCGIIAVDTIIGFSHLGAGDGNSPADLRLLFLDVPIWVGSATFLYFFVKFFLDESEKIS